MSGALLEKERQVDKTQPQTQRAQSLVGEIPNVTVIAWLEGESRVLRKLRRGDPHPAQLWTGGLLEGHFAPTEKEGWAGLMILVSENDGDLRGWIGALKGMEGERPHLLHEFARGSPVAKQVFFGPVLLSPRITGGC